MAFSCGRLSSDSISWLKLESESKVFLVILGPTGVGKSSAGVRLARSLGGEIISCDSMQVYRGFDIGTDKPPLEVRREIPHHLLDVADSTRQFTAADFAEGARDAIIRIRERGKVPLVVGGTGLYIQALVDGLFPGQARDDRLRRELGLRARGEGLDRLYEELEKADPAYALKTGRRDKVRIIRALEVYALTGKPISAHFLETASPVKGCRAVKIGLTLDRPTLYRRIEARVERMFAEGLVEETRRLLEQGVDENSPPFRALGYRHVLRLLRNEVTQEEAKEATKIDTRHYAKRQMTWFRKMKNVRWFSPDDYPSLEAFAKSQLND